MTAYVLELGSAQATYRDALEGVAISVPQEGCLGLARFQDPPTLTWPDGFRAAFDRPVGSRRLRAMARGAHRVAVIVSDATRGIPTAQVMPLILEELASAGVDKAQVTVVIATGVHRPATQDEIRAIVGCDLVADLTVVNHDPHDPKKLVLLGTTSYGTPVEINRTVFEADLRIAVGKVEPHEFAGFSGARKSILPGVSSERTIRINHRPEMLMSPWARPGQLDGNPIHLDMLEAARMANVAFTVSLVLNQAGGAVGVFTGDLEESHLAAVSFMRSYCQVGMPQAPDIVVTTPGEPLNINFYQSVKPLIALAPVMRPGGVLVLYVSCRDGLGTRDMLVPYEGAKDIHQVIERLKSAYRIEMDHALLLTKILLQGTRIIVAAPNVGADVLQRMFLSTAASPQAAVEMAVAMSGKPRPTILFFPQAQRALSVLGKS